MTTILGDAIDLLILSVFSTFAQGRARICLLGFFRALSANMTSILGEGIDLSILLIFRYSSPETGENMPTGVSHCAEHEYDNHFGLGYRFIDFIDFFHLRSGTGEDMSGGFSQYA
ncbi:hypothetical protein Y032_0333g2799 [Ancylostoma ceylanicum]|nr:hypothetical protein Y032_0333g2799 [Ancylostoma ceylanicum]